MAQKSDYQLYVYEGDCGLVSMDPESIQSILYLKIAQFEVNVHNLNSLKHCFKYRAPSLVNDRLVAENFAQIQEYTKNKDKSIDGHLSAKQSSEMFALTNFVESKLKPIVDFVFWMDLRNSEEFTGPWYMKSLTLPFNYSRIKSEQRRVEHWMDNLYPNEPNINLLKSYTLTALNEALTSISARLGSGDYFFQQPTSLDVILYSYLAPLIKLPFPSTEYGNLFNMWSNLQQFVKRIDAKYFSDVPVEAKYLKKEPVKLTGDDEISYAAVAILVLSTVTLAFGFCVNKGLIRS